MARTQQKITSDAGKLLKKNPELTHSDNRKVSSHVQRDEGEWIINTLLLDDSEVPFKFKRKQAYRDLKGARVNLTYYPDSETVAGISMEVMRVVRIRKS